MSFYRLRYELLVMGRRAILTPVLVMGCSGLFAGLLAYLNTYSNRFLPGVLEMFLPLSAGIIIATIVTQDPAIELQLTVPEPYRRTTLRRLTLIVCWSSCTALLTNIVLLFINGWYVPQQLRAWSLAPQFLVGQLAWVAPLLWFAAVGLCLASLTHNSIATSSLLGGIWLIESVFSHYIASTLWLRPVFLFPTTLTPDADFWLTNRIELIVTALVLLPTGYLLLRNTEGLLKGSSEE